MEEDASLNMKTTIYTIINKKSTTFKQKQVVNIKLITLLDVNNQATIVILVHKFLNKCSIIILDEVIIFSLTTGRTTKLKMAISM